ncbi:hypothetical protein SBDP1_120005 [Syntrophobacter sp. SbD1]|nr:hypothetical protein SBDP1_120005 [Syntrophobacter sp. SbD1]
MKIIFSRLAKQDLDDALHYYELQYRGLGRRFKEEARQAALRITEYPEAWSIERGGIRKCLLHKFPYKLLYSMFVTGIRKQNDSARSVSLRQIPATKH